MSFVIFNCSQIFLLTSNDSIVTLDNTKIKHGHTFITFSNSLFFLVTLDSANVTLTSTNITNDRIVTFNNSFILFSHVKWFRRQIDGSLSLFLGLCGWPIVVLLVDFFNCGCWVNYFLGQLFFIKHFGVKLGFRGGANGVFVMVLVVTLGFHGGVWFWVFL